MRFCANISLLFSEVPFLERFSAARAAGFDAVEFWWPRGEELAAVTAAVAAADVDVALFNFDAGDMPAGDRGLLSSPLRQAEFRANVPVALDLAQVVGCRRINALVGLEVPELGRLQQLELAAGNVRLAADQAAELGIEILIEAVNTLENGPYLLSTTQAAAEFVAFVARPNVRLQYDVYHMQRMEGNLTATLAHHVDRIAHIQVADSPGRGQPGTGEINFDYVFGRIEDLGYADYVGLEYKPSGGDTAASLEWLPRAGRASRGQA